MEEKLDIFKVARCMYANGIAYLSDAEYDELAEELKQSGVRIDPIYENDPIPYDSFERLIGIDKTAVDKLLNIQAEQTTHFTSATESDLDFLAESAMLSIRSVNKFSDAYAWFKEVQGLDIVISTKIDGINTRRGYRLKGKTLEFAAALTRGRKSDPINVSSNIAKISPNNISTDIEGDLLLYSETVVPFEAIDYINDKYNDTYTIPRNLAMAMMRVDRFDADDYKYLKSFVFKVDYGTKLSDGLDLAKQLGFDTVPYLHYTYQGESYEEFCEQMEEYIHALKSQADSMGIITDGMVAEINDRSIFSRADVANSYSSANLALKIGLWQPGVYESEVVDLDLTQQNDRCACVAIVKPVTAKGGQKISRVNCYNPSVLFTHKIIPGCTIRFEYKNETTVDILLN